MKLQARDSDCSVAALQNALRLYGHRPSYRKLRYLLGEAGEGADEADVKRTIAEFGFRAVELETSRNADADAWLREWAPRAPVILCVDNWGHWVMVAGRCGNRLHLEDGGPDPLNLAECGGHWLTPLTVLRRWRAASKQRRHGGLYYGIAVARGEQK